MNSRKASDNTLPRIGQFVLSFDTELAWGMYDMFRPQRFSPDGQREREAVDQILELLEEFDITATWAIVGHMFYEKCEECAVCPVLEWEGKYPWFEDVYKNNHPLWYGNDIVETLLTRGSKHEIGFHGYTHKLFDEDASSETEIRTEIEEWLRKSRERDLTPGSVTFPRNVIGYRDLLKEYGFICYRSRDIVPRVHSLKLIGKLLKHLDLTFALSTPPVRDLQFDQSGLVIVPSSFELFGFNRSVERVLDSLKLHNLRMRRFVKGVKKAASEGKIVHYWAHPYEFTTRSDFEKLRYLLSRVADEVARGRMQSVGMAELAKSALSSAKIAS